MEILRNKIEGLPKDVEDLLVDDGYLKMAQAEIEAADVSLKARIAEARSAVTVGDRFRSLLRKTPERVSAIQTLEQDARRNLDGLLKIQRLTTMIDKALVNQVEDLLRNTDRDYVRGLVAHEHLEDWKRAIDRFEEHMRMLIKAIGEARNTVVANYDRARQQISRTGEVSLDIVREDAHTISMEVDFVNRIAEAHSTLTKGSACEGLDLPRMPVVDYVGWVARLRLMEIGPMQVEFNGFIAAIEHLAKDGVGALRAALLTKFEEHEKANDSYVLNRLAAMREHCRQYWLQVEMVDAAILEIEREQTIRQDRYALLAKQRMADEDEDVEAVVKPKKRKRRPPPASLLPDLQLTEIAPPPDREKAKNEESAWSEHGNI